MKVVVSGVCVSVFLSFLPQPLAAERLVNGARFGAWTVSCEALAVNETVCVLSQRLVRANDGGLLADLLAFAGAEAPSAWVAARLPNGVYFPAGFSLRADDPEAGEDRIVAFEWQSCSPEICEALVEVDTETASAFEMLPEWVAAYSPAIDAEPLVFRMDPSGLQEGLVALATAMGHPDPFATPSQAE